MNNKYEDLAKRVEAGEILFTTDYQFGDEHHNTIHRALLGSLDAAKALHEAVLPGWGVSIYSPTKDFGRWEVQLETPAIRAAFDKEPVPGTAPTPAAAWVAAILRAKGSRENE